MKDFDNIEDWYRNELNKFNVEPDKNVWDSLSDDLDANMTLTDENIGEWYKREAAKLEERPDYTVWEKLATKLDTASVWDRLVISLNRHEQYIWWKNVIIKGSAVLLLLTGSYISYKNYKADKGINNPNKNTTINKYSLNNNTITVSKSTSHHNTPINTNTTHNISSSSYPSTSDKLIVNSIHEAKTSTIASIKNNNSNNSKTTYASLNNTTKEVHFNSINITDLSKIRTTKERDIIEADRRNITERDISHIYNSSDFLIKKEKNKIVFNTKRFSSHFTYGLYARRFYFGVNAGVKKQGLITHIKKDNPLTNFNQVAYLDFGSNFGVTAGYIMSDKFNIEANLNALSSSGYKRKYSGEDSFNEELNLSYTTISILAKKINTKSTFDNKVYSTNLIGGVYASLLNSCNSSINGNKIKNKNFNNIDFGIVLGIEQDRYITKTIIITPGIRYNQGIANIANKSGHFKSAQNFSFEFNLGIKYIFLKKSK